MERNALKEALEAAEGVRAEDGAETRTFIITSAASATVFAAGTPEIITIGRVARVALAPAHVAVTTSRGERFYFDYGAIVGLKLEPSEERAQDRGAGFR